MGALLGGPRSPIGWSVGWIELPKDDVLSALLAWRRKLGQAPALDQVTEPWPACLGRLDPLEAQWTTELVVAHGPDWTCYLNNDSGGGDPFPAMGYLSRNLGRRAVIAVHQPRIPVGHASTQFQLFGPDGEPPLMYLRTLAANAEDGRWSWDEYGVPQPYEKPERYTRRLIRERLDRALLVEYLAALGIPADDDTSYGPATVVRQRFRPGSRKQSLAEAQASLGLG